MIEAFERIEFFKYLSKLIDNEEKLKRIKEIAETGPAVIHWFWSNKPWKQLAEEIIRKGKTRIVSEDNFDPKSGDISFNQAMSLTKNLQALKSSLILPSSKDKLYGALPHSYREWFSLLQEWCNEDKGNRDRTIEWLNKCLVP